MAITGAIEGLRCASDAGQTIGANGPGQVAGATEPAPAVGANGPGQVVGATDPGPAVGAADPPPAVGANGPGQVAAPTAPGHAARTTDPVRALRAASTILLADDHALVRAGLRLLLEEMGFRVVAEAGDVDETVRKAGAYKPSVVILDLNMPGGSSLAAIPILKEVSPLTAIVVLTMQDEPAFAQHALRAGALGFVLKEAADDELVEALDAALEGRRYLNPQLGARIALQPSRVPAPPHDLTKRELQVLKLLARGHTNAEVAEQLFLSVRTVEAHRSHIQHKVGHISRSELVAYARQHGLLG